MNGLEQDEDEEMIEDLPTPNQNSLNVPKFSSNSKKNKLSSFKKISTDTKKANQKKAIDPYLIDSDEEEMDAGIMVRPMNSYFRTS